MVSLHLIYPDLSPIPYKPTATFSQHQQGYVCFYFCNCCLDAAQKFFSFGRRAIILLRCQSVTSRALLFGVQRAEWWFWVWELGRALLPLEIKQLSDVWMPLNTFKGSGPSCSVHWSIQYWLIQGGIACYSAGYSNFSCSTVLDWKQRCQRQPSRSIGQLISAAEPCQCHPNIIRGAGKKYFVLFTS